MIIVFFAILWQIYILIDYKIIKTTLFIFEFLQIGFIIEFQSPLQRFYFTIDERILTYTLSWLDEILELGKEQII